MLSFSTPDSRRTTEPSGKTASRPATWPASCRSASPARRQRSSRPCRPSSRRCARRGRCRRRGPRRARGAEAAQRNAGADDDLRRRAVDLAKRRQPSKRPTTSPPRGTLPPTSPVSPACGTTGNRCPRRSPGPPRPAPRRPAARRPRPRRRTDRSRRARSPRAGRARSARALADRRAEGRERRRGRRRSVSDGAVLIGRLAPCARVTHRYRIHVIACRQLVRGCYGPAHVDPSRRGPGQRLPQVMRSATLSEKVVASITERSSTACSRPGSGAVGARLGEQSGVRAR